MITTAQGSDLCVFYPNIKIDVPIAKKDMINKEYTFGNITLELSGTDKIEFVRIYSFSDEILSCYSTANVAELVKGLSTNNRGDTVTIGIEYTEKSGHGCVFISCGSAGKSVISLIRCNTVDWENTVTCILMECS